MFEPLSIQLRDSSYEIEDVGNDIKIEIVLQPFISIHEPLRVTRFDNFDGDLNNNLLFQLQQDKKKKND
jgi:hypothetical protein